MLFRVGESVDLLSNRVWDLFLSRIDVEINRFAWGLEVNNGVRERELLLYFGRAEVRKKRVGTSLGRKGKGIYTSQPSTVT